MIYDPTDTTTASAVEAAIKDANVNGIAGYTNPAMSEAQYDAAGGIGQSINRDMAAAVVGTLRSVPMRVAICTLGSLPAPVEGSVIFVRDGARGAACLAFSDGTAWLRCDTLSIVG